MKNSNASMFLFFSPWTRRMAVLDTSVVPETKLTLHWMMVLLYATQRSLMNMFPDLILEANPTCVSIILVRSSRRVPFKVHWIGGAISSVAIQEKSALVPWYLTILDGVTMTTAEQ